MLKRLQLNITVKRIIIIFVLSFLIFPHLAMAQEVPGFAEGCGDIPEESDTYKPIIINFNLPGITKPYIDTKNSTPANNKQYQVKDLQCFIVGIYVYFSGVAGILATVMIMYGGVKYVISMGNPSRMGDAKDTIFSAVVGLVLVLGAYVLLNLINPNITTLKVPGLGLESVVSAADECDDTATPLVAGKTLCGDKGTYEKIVEGKEIKSECVYKHCINASFMPNAPKTVCIQGTKDNLEADVYECITPKIACERVTDKNASSNQASCDPYSIDGKGICKWIDFDGPNDNCVWIPRIACPDDSWSQVDCGECNSNNIECGNWGVFDNECNASASTILYQCETDAGAVRSHSGTGLFDRWEECQEAICCKKISSPTAEYPINSLKCTREPLAY